MDCVGFVGRLYHSYASPSQNSWETIKKIREGGLWLLTHVLNRVVSRVPQLIAFTSNRNRKMIFDNLVVTSFVVLLNNFN